VPFAAVDAARAHLIGPDAQERLEFALDADIDFFAGARTNENQAFHATTPVRDILAV
jgi:hypothetical protein